MMGTAKMNEKNSGHAMDAILQGGDRTGRPGEPAKAKATILIVEDEFITGADLQNNLRNMGYDVPVVVDTGEGAIKKAGELHPDLVLMDITLIGKMTGIPYRSRICAAASMPVISPMSVMSMRTRSGCSSPAFLIAPSPVSTTTGTS
jgi:hypothetical protein